MKLERITCGVSVHTPYRMLLLYQSSRVLLRKLINPQLRLSLNQRITIVTFLINLSFMISLSSLWFHLKLNTPFVMYHTKSCFNTMIKLLAPNFFRTFMLLYILSFELFDVKLSTCTSYSFSNFTLTLLS